MKFLDDVAKELKNMPQDKVTLRKFGITMAVAVALIGAFIFFKGSVPERANILWGVAGAFLLLGLGVPAVLKPVHKIWMGLAFVMGWFMSRLLLGLVYFLAVTPVSIGMRIAGKDLLDEKIDKNAGSYWKKKEKTEISIARYKKLY